jgi:hypothetical protein
MNSTSRISRRISEEFFSRAGRTVRLLAASIVICFLLPASFPTKARAAEAIASKTAVVDGLRLHYLTAGHGPTVILLHGYTQTSRMWRPIIPLLAGKFTVIAPDLPGIGDSGIPKDGLDMKDAAIRILSTWRNFAKAWGSSRRTRHRTHGCVCLCSHVSQRGGKAGCHGRVSARR